MNYIKRYIESKILRHLANTSVVVLTGPRQSGKSTLLQNLFKEWEYVSFDNIQLRDEANRDPGLFLKKYPDKAIFDEVQKVPDLFDEVKLKVDTDKEKRFILSGSSNFLLMSKIKESLAGRISICELYPFSISESGKTKQNSFLRDLEKVDSVEEIKIKKKPDVSFDKIINFILYGGFPKVVLTKNKDEKSVWFQGYQTTIIEKDFRDFIKVKNLQEFSKLYRMLSYQTASLINYSNLANDLSVSQVTVKEYINLLISSYQFFYLIPYFKKMKARLVKTPKLYSFDTGLSNFLERILDKNRLLDGGRFGDVFENWVILELLKQKSLLDIPPDFYFWRTNNGQEVDLVIDFVTKIVPVEIKSSSKIDKSSAKGITSFMDYHKGTKTKIPFGIVIYLGDESFYLTENIMAVPVGCVV